MLRRAHSKTAQMRRTISQLFHQSSWNQWFRLPKRAHGLKFQDHLETTKRFPDANKVMDEVQIEAKNTKRHGTGQAIHTSWEAEASRGVRQPCKTRPCADLRSTHEYNPGDNYQIGGIDECRPWVWWSSSQTSECLQS